MSRSIAIIPARMNSTRFPGKPMELIGGIPMIGHVYYRSKMASNVDVTCVATCDRVIYDYIEGIGGDAVMTSFVHERATDRAAEALMLMEEKIQQKFDFIAMIQGDEPLVMPNDIDEALSLLQDSSSTVIVNLMTKIKAKEEFESHNEVKVVTDLNDNALYFSREPIPSQWHGDKSLPMKKQTGLIFFKRDYLIKFNNLEQTPLECIEAVDMMRVIENGQNIKMLMIDGDNIGVDTADDLVVAERMIDKDKIFKSYEHLSGMSHV